METFHVLGAPLQIDVNDSIMGIDSASVILNALLGNLE